MTFFKTKKEGYKPCSCSGWTRCFETFCDNYINRDRIPEYCCSIKDMRIQEKQEMVEPSESIYIKSGTFLYLMKENYDIFNDKNGT